MSDSPKNARPTTEQEENDFQAAVKNLVPSIATARESWEFAGKAYSALSGRPDSEDHRVFVELVLYLASLDYETKTLLHQFHLDLENRAVWEKYLGLTLYEGIPTVQKLSGAYRIKLRQQEGEDSPKLAGMQRAMVKFNSEVKVVRGDTTFWAMLTRLRNEVAAHHTGRRDSAMSLQASWAVASENSRTRDYHSNMSMIGQYSLLLGRAVQTLGEDISGLSAQH